MSCQTCGREAEGDHQGHWLGCEEGAKASSPRVPKEPAADQCDFGTCANQKKAWSGKGPKPKYCEEHGDPKNRK